MKLFYCLLFTFFTYFNYAQHSPPPPGCSIFGVIDTDNDGFAAFNVEWYLHEYYPALLAAQYGFDLSGYTLQWNPAIAPIYTNTSANFEFIYINFIYSGNGPYYEQLDIAAAYYNCIQLLALSANGDEDNDGIPNADEDLNGNGNLTDDDSDTDWSANFLDTDPVLAVGNLKIQAVAMHPNPAQSVVFFDSGVKGITAMATDGKEIELRVKDNSINVSELPNGLYLISGRTAQGRRFTAKLIKN